MSLGTPTSDGVGTAAADLSRDQVFDLLANTRRRCVLHYLRRVEGAADQRKRVYTSLQQTHLRKLEDAGIVEYDDEAARVHPTEATGDIEVYLEVVPGQAFPWREYYLALGAVSSALVIVVWANVGPFGLLPDIGLAGLLAAVLTLSSVAHVHYERNMRLSSLDDPPELTRE